jgi:hypothetical protein
MLHLRKGFRRKKKLYFLHIPKTAGTSVSNVLSQISVGKDLKMVGPILIDHLIEMPNWEESDLLAGHLGLLPLEYKFDYFTVLREPLQRLYSYYSHVKRDSFHYHHKIVDGERLDFLGYLLDDRFYNINFNMQTRYLSTKPRTNSSDKKKVHAQKSSEFENSPKNNVNLELALRTLENASWVGNSSNLGQLGRFLEMRFDFPGIQFPYLNQNPASGKTFSPAEIEAAKPLIELDTILWQSWKN